MPDSLFGDTRGWVTGMEVIEMELGTLHESSRRKPIPVKGSERGFDVDTVIVAVGHQDRNASHFSSAQDVAANLINRATPIPIGSEALVRLSVDTRV